MLKAAVIAGALALSAAGAEIGTARVPVLLELFTSEGCSSCPPADRLLQVLDDQQPIPGAYLIVLSEHVDYWDRLGWKDPFSSAQFSARQAEYASKFDLDGAYTPQLVVDGRFQLVGSEARPATSAIQKSIRNPKPPITLQASRDGSQIVAHVDVPADQSLKTRRGVLYVALADNHMESHVARGENVGRVLAHVAVTRALTKVRTVSFDSATNADVTFTLQPGQGGSGSRIVAFVQDPKSGAILAVAEQKL